MTNSQPTPDPEPKKPGLENQLEPDTGATTDLPTQGKTYTAAQVNKFFTDATRGVYRNRDDEFEKIKKDILLAQSESRIKP